MSASIAAEAQTIVHRAAEPISAGETIKGQLRRAARALGMPDGSWRVRAAWYGEAGSWSAAAMDDLRIRARKWAEREEAKAHAQAQLAYANASAVRSALAATDPDFNRAEIDRLEQLMDELRQFTSRGGR